MLIPLFPTFPQDVGIRIENCLVKVRDKGITDSTLLESLNRIMGVILKEYAENSRVKGDFKEKVPPLVGKRLFLQIHGLNPWIVEIVPIPQVMVFKPSSEKEVNSLPRISGEFNVMKEVFKGTADTTKLVEVIGKDQIGFVNASPSNPAPWIKDLFLLLGPSFDRKDIREKVISKSMPVIDAELRKLGF